MSEIKSIFQASEYHETAIQDYSYQDTASKLSNAGSKTLYKSSQI